MGLLDMMGSGSARRSGGSISPMALALIGVLGYQAVKNKGRLSELLGGAGQGGTGQTGSMPGASPGAGAQGGLGGRGSPGGGQGSGSGGGVGGGLGGLLGGGALSGGLRDLLGRFRQSGHEQVAQSWVSREPNKSIAPHELESALGEERLQWLVEQTGMPRDQLVAGLSRELPEAVDRLTPEGRIPSDEELERLVAEPESRPASR